MSFRVKKLMEVAAKFGNVTFLNFSADPKYNFKNEKFSDVFHLNQKGAEEFSTELVGYLGSADKH